MWIMGRCFSPTQCLFSQICRTMFSRRCHSKTGFYIYNSYFSMQPFEQTELIIRGIGSDVCVARKVEREMPRLHWRPVCTLPVCTDDFSIWHLSLEVLWVWLTAPRMTNRCPGCRSLRNDFHISFPIISKHHIWTTLPGIQRPPND